MTRKNFFVAALLTALFQASIVAFPAAAQEQRIMAIARDSAVLAGGGRFCKFDPDEVEEFISKAEARLSLLAKDEYEKVLARLEFKNNLDAFSVKEPSGGCADFRAVFNRARASIQ